VTFFLQAEDGIRDRNVTGVQTCALPISLPPSFTAIGWSLENSVLKIRASSLYFCASISLIANKTINKATRRVSISEYGSNQDSSILLSLRCFFFRMYILLIDVG